MTDSQAQFVRKLYYDQSCSYQTVARKYYEEYGPNKLCNDPKAVIYYDIEKKKTVYHNYCDGDIECDKYSIVEKLFDDVSGSRLVKQSDDVLGIPVNAFAEQLEYED
jgi:hypothetical protein